MHKPRLKSLSLILSISSTGLLALLLVFVAVKRVKPLWFRTSYFGPGRLPSVFADLPRRTAHCPSRALPSVEGAEILFVGDSLVQNVPWQNYFARAVTLNHGISGDTVDCLLYRIGSSLKAKPKSLVVLVGINDLLEGRSVGIVASLYWLLVSQLSHSYPEMDVTLVKVFPVNAEVCWYCFIDSKRIDELNQKIGEIAREFNVRVIDLKAELSDGKGNLNASYTGDGLHLNQAGIERFVHAVKEQRSLASVGEAAK